MNCFAGLIDHDRMKGLRNEGDDRRTSSFFKQARSSFLLSRSESGRSSKPFRVTRIKELEQRRCINRDKGALDGVEPTDHHKIGTDACEEDHPQD